MNRKFIINSRNLPTFVTIGLFILHVWIRFSSVRKLPFTAEYF